MSASSIISAELQQAAQVLNSFLAKEENIAAIEKAAAVFVNALKGEGKIISCGNGGSACDAMHFAEELTGRFRDNRAPIAAISISDAGHITCTANDYGYDQVFSRYVQALGRKGDVLLAISTSGNSENVIKAAEAAKSAGMKVVSLTGKDGGKLAKISDVNVNVTHQGYADRVQEVHIKIIHIFILLIEKQLMS